MHHEKLAPVSFLALLGHRSLVPGSTESLQPVDVLGIRGLESFIESHWRAVCHARWCVPQSLVERNCMTFDASSRGSLVTLLQFVLDPLGQTVAD